MSASCLGQLRGLPWAVAQVVGDAELCRDVDRLRQVVTANHVGELMPCGGQVHLWCFARHNCPCESTLPDKLAKTLTRVRSGCGSIVKGRVRNPPGRTK